MTTNCEQENAKKRSKHCDASALAVAVVLGAVLCMEGKSLSLSLWLCVFIDRCVLICLVAFERKLNRGASECIYKSVQSHLLVAVQTHADTSWFEQLLNMYDCLHM